MIDIWSLVSECILSPRINITLLKILCDHCKDFRQVIWPKSTRALSASPDRGHLDSAQPDKYFQGRCEIR